MQRYRVVGITYREVYGEPARGALTVTPHPTRTAALERAGELVDGGAADVRAYYTDRAPPHNEVCFFKHVAPTEGLPV
jgi:hypothetical protein